jgi:hypothetical protein
VGRVLAVAATAVLAAFGFTAAAAAKAPVFKVLDGRIDQRVEVNATYVANDGCWEEHLILVASSDYSLQAERGTKVKLAPSEVLGAHSIKGLRFTGAGENLVSQDQQAFGPMDPENCPSSPGLLYPSDTAGCGAERVSPATTLQLTETAKGTSTEAFFSPGGGMALFGPLSDPDGAAFTCHTGSDFGGGVTFPAPSNKKRQALAKADGIIKLRGDASYSGSDAFSDCFCDRIDGYQDIDMSWALKLKRVGNNS